MLCRWQLQPDRRWPQTELLAALHCHCMQLLAQASDHLPAELCSLKGTGIISSSNGSGDGYSSGSGSGTGNSSSSIRSGGSPSQQAAWQRCIAEVQHNLLLVLQLTKHLQDHNERGSLDSLLAENM